MAKRPSAAASASLSAAKSALRLLVRRIEQDQAAALGGRQPGAQRREALAALDAQALRHLALARAECGERLLQCVRLGPLKLDEAAAVLGAQRRRGDERRARIEVGLPERRAQRADEPEVVAQLRGRGGGREQTADSAVGFRAAAGEIVGAAAGVRVEDRNPLSLRFSAAMSASRATCLCTSAKLPAW